jgi:uncharacterized protein YsxB (DUF464 family)
MIRIFMVQDTLDDEGASTLLITGHANPLVCAGVSALWHTFNDGLARIAKEHPRQVAYHATLKKKQSTRR